MNETNITPNLLDDPATIEADHQAVQNFVEHNTPLDPAVQARVRARADRIREKCFQRHGYIDTESLRRPSTVDDE